MSLIVNNYEIKPGANLKEALLYEADLKGADLYGAILRDADLKGANLKGADLEEADLKGADLYGAILRDADLKGANLKGADLTRADLTRADLKGADLRGADLEGADLEGADLEEANLKGADLKGAKGFSSKEQEMQSAQTIRKALLISGNELEMSSWHKCKTIHCLRGWEEVLNDVDPSQATHNHPTLCQYYYSSNEQAMEALKRVASGEESIYND